MLQENNKITVAQIIELRMALLNTTVAITALNTKATKILSAITNEFLNNSKMDQEICNSINSIDGEMLKQIVISRLSYKIPRYGYIGEFSTFKLEEAKLILSKTIVDGLTDLGHIPSRSEVVREVVNGKSVYTTKTYLDMGELTEKNILKGLSDTPAQMLSSKVHTKPGAFTMKLNKDQKDFVKKLSSMEFRLVKIGESRLRAYYYQTEWYNSSLEKGIEDKILLNARVEKYISIILELQEKPVIHLSNWFDSRLRLYYELTMLGINPHGDSFETHMWELANAEIITKIGYEALMHSAVTIATGKRHSHQATTKMWIKNKATYLDKLVHGNHSYGELFYNDRLVQALKDYESGTASHFMMGEDATTGGLQHGGIGFKSVKSMKASNVGGLKTPQDAHKQLGDSFGLNRDMAKKINTPLLHGSTFKTIATRLSKDTGTAVDEAYVRSHVVATYGEEILNVPTIATWGTKAYDNYNTSLMFTALDGWKCQSTGYIKSVPLKVYSLSLKAKDGYTMTKLHRDMPLVLSNKGETIYENTKTRGVYARS